MRKRKIKSQRQKRFTCFVYRKKYETNTNFPIKKEICESAEFQKWLYHGIDCKNCSEWAMIKQLEMNEIRWRKYPCVHMAFYSNLLCGKCKTVYQCPDVAILYHERFDEFSIKRGKSDSYVIEYCPWCGKKLPKSKRAKWINAIEKMGLEPGSRRIPKKYCSDKWYRQYSKSK